MIRHGFGSVAFERTARALSAIRKSSEPLLLQRASRGVILKVPAYVDAPPESKSRFDKVLE